MAVSLHHSSQEIARAQEPLSGYDGLYPAPGPPAISNSPLIGLDLHKIPFRAEELDYIPSRRLEILSDEDPRLFGHESSGVHDPIIETESMLLRNREAARIMTWCQGDDPGSGILIYRVVCNDRDLLVENRENDFSPDKLLVTLIFRMDCDRLISQ